MAIVRIDVKPEILHWVQENTGTVLDGEWSDRINKWVTNEKKPTLNQLKNLSKKAQVPFGYFFLESTPKENLPLLKYRTVDNVYIEKPSRNLIDTIHDMELKQSWLSDYREKNDYPASPFSCGYKMISNLTHKNDEQIASEIMRSLGIKSGWNVGFKNREGFKFLRKKLNRVGVIVMFSGMVGNNTRRLLSQSEFRAFALNDTFAPLIFINSNDSYNAMLFSLVHELTHIWYGTSELYNDDFKEEQQILDLKNEQKINHISEAIIFPKLLFTDEWQQQSGEKIIDKIIAVAKHFNASPLSTGIRAFHLDLIEQNSIDQLKKELDRDYQYKKNNKEGQKDNGGPTFYITKATQIDSSFTKDIKRGVIGGELEFNKAFELLGVKNSTAFDKLLSKIEGKG
jgi:Zn-dependent peptidase ImmA (M78 family)